jgi:hypothetical protein
MTQRNGLKTDLINSCPGKYATPDEIIVCLAKSEEDCSDYKACPYMSKNVNDVGGK